MQNIHSNNAYSQSAVPTGTINSGDQVFIASPAPNGGNIPMHQMGLANQPLVVNSQPTEPGVFLLNGKHVFRLGIVSTIVGFAVFVCGICCVAVFGELDYNVASGGIWGGVFIMVAGSLSIVSGRRLTNRVLNAVNLGFHSFVLICCIGCLALFCLNIEYYDSCIRRYTIGYFNYYNEIINTLCPAERDGAVAVYSLMVVLAFVQMGLSIAVITFCCRAYPSCRSGNCCSSTNGCCSGTSANNSSTNYRQQTQFQTGYANMSPNVQSIPPGQILYMMTPVAVTTQRPQEMPANQMPQATIVMH